MTKPARPLAELSPTWIVDKDGRIHGLRFACPIHKTVPGNPEFECFHSIGFENPPDGGAKQAYWRATWQRRGETFETLALSPSIRCLGYDGGGGCRWHGYVGGSAGECPGMVVTLDDSR